MNEGIVVDCVLVTREVEGKWNNTREVKEKRLKNDFHGWSPIIKYNILIDIRVDLLQLITENQWLWHNHSKFLVLPRKYLNLYTPIYDA